MVTNPVFTHYGTDTEQDILNDLTIESIQISGIDILYMPRHIFNKNPILGEDPGSYFTEAVPLEIYIENAEGYQGDGNFLSKFGLEIRDRVTLSMSITRFKQQVGDPHGLLRPNEGDLIFFPLNKKIFEIRFVDPFTMFYPLGGTYVYKMTCELFEYSSEKFDTTQEDVDNIKQFSEDLYTWAIKTEDGKPILTEDNRVLVVDNYNTGDIMKLDDSENIQTKTDQFLDFSETNPYSHGAW